MAITPITDTTVNIMPSAPERSDSCRFMLKPRHTTATCSRYFDVFLLNLGQGMSSTKANTRPQSSATGAEMLGRPTASSGNTISAISAMYTILESFMLELV